MTTIGGAIEKRSYESMYITDTKSTKSLRATTIAIAKFEEQ